MSANRPLWVLQVEESEGDAALVRAHLEKAGYEVYSERVHNAGQMRAALARAGWDVIICNYGVTRFGAPAALRVLHEAHQDIPFIVVSGVAGEDVAVAMMKMGAQDFLLKDRLALLAAAVDRELREARLRREGAQAGKELERTQSLLREIHHRVKNNLQVVSSLLGLQSRSSANAETKKLLGDIRNRIHSMVLLHETLYDSSNPALVDFRSYIEELTEHLYSSYDVDRKRVRSRLELAHHLLDLDVALPCGLILNEALSNALEHAFTDGRTGEMRIVLKEEPAGTATLLLSDNGIGLDPSVVPTASGALGFRLMHMLARQLGGTLEISSHGGTTISLVFPLPQPSECAALGGGDHIVSPACA